VGTSGNDYATDLALGNLPEFFDWYFAREDLGRNPEFPDFTCDKVAVLTACVKDDYLGQFCYFRILSSNYFRIRSTIIFFALLMSACAFGSASMACSTSGSVLISYLRLSSTLKAVL